MKKKYYTLVFASDPWYKMLMTFTVTGCLLATMVVLPWLIARIIIGLVLLAVNTIILLVGRGSMVESDGVGFDYFD